MKKILALVLAAAMMMSMVAIAFAADGYQTEPAGTITIGNLEEGDEVVLYKVIGWYEETVTVGSATNTKANWKVYAPFTSFSEDVHDYEELTPDEVAAIGNALTDSAQVAATATVGSSKQITTEALPVGMYLAVVKTATEYIYNPMIFSINFSQSTPPGATNVTSDADATYILPDNTAGAAKKQPTTLDKETDTDNTDFDADEENNNLHGKEDGVYVGATLPFYVTVTIPNYNEAYEDPIFTITDTLSSGLKLDTNSIKVYVGDETSTTLLAQEYYTLDPAVTGYEIDILDDYLYLVKTEQQITIKYEAEVTTDAIYNVNREKNYVELKYSNNPSDESDYVTTSDETNHYTFSLDAAINGEKHGRNDSSELIKTGLDNNGNPVYSWNNLTSDEWTKQMPLAQAKFKLSGKRDNEDWSEYYYSDADGRITIKGLDEGTYTLEEVEAPAGWIKDPNTHNVEISATYYYDTNGNGKRIKKLESYKVTIDGNETTYTVTNDPEGDEVTTSEVIKNETTNIVNTKGVELPSTGGIGTTLFYLVGGLMALVAGVMVIARKKADEE